MSRPGLYANIHAKENVEARCERKVQKVHQRKKILNEQNKQQRLNYD